MILELSLVLVVLLLLVVYLVSPDAHTRRCGAKIPGPPPYPIIGNLYEAKFKHEGTDIYLRMVEKYGHVLRYWIGYKLAVLLSDPDDAEVVFRDTTNISKSELYDFLHPWLGQGLLTSKGYKWHIRRKAITPTFHFKVLEQFLDIFQAKSRILVECLSEKADGKIFDIHPDMSRFSLDVICESAMGISVNAQKNLDEPYVSAIRRITTLIADRMVTMWLHPYFMFKLFGKEKAQNETLKIIHDFANKVISEQAKKLEEKGENSKIEEDFGIKKKTAFLELLMRMKAEKNAAFSSDIDVREEVDTFMFEGHDTTASAISCAVYSLGENPEVQEKAYQEAYEVLGNHEGPLTLDILQKLTYLDRVIKETLRIYPSVPVVARSVTKDIDLPSGYTVPAGSIICVSIGGIHLNPKYYPDPLTFDPDRFLPEKMVNRHPYAYVPFSAGLRNCIGQKFAVLEMKACLSQVLLNFEIGVGEKILAGMVLTLQSDNGVQVYLRPRKSSSA